VKVNTENGYGESPLDMAKGNPVITELLVAHGVRPKFLTLLPAELLLHIFSYLRTVKSLCFLAMVCRKFNLISADDQLWYRLHSSSSNWTISPG